MIEIKSLFPTPLIVVELGAAMVGDLQARILDHAARVPGVLRSNEGGWQSQDDFQHWGGDSAATILKAACELADRTTALPPYEAPRAPIAWKVHAWANVNRSGDANARHVHGGAVWSGIFYVDDGGVAGGDALGGALALWDPRGALPLMYAPAAKLTAPGSVNAGLAELHYPKTGQLLLFPSWLPHSVEPYRGGATRISVAFNLSL